MDANGVQIPIYDPNTTVVLPDGTVQRQQFPGNIIPMDRIDPIAQEIIDKMPEPSSDVLTNNAFDITKNAFGTGIKTFKVDHSLTSRSETDGHIQPGG